MVFDRQSTYQDYQIANDLRMIYTRTIKIPIKQYIFDFSFLDRNLKDSSIHASKLTYRNMNENAFLLAIFKNKADDSKNQEYHHYRLGWLAIRGGRRIEVIQYNK